MARDTKAEKTDTNTNAGNEGDRPMRPQTGTPDPRPAGVTEVKPGEPRETDESGDAALQNADNPGVVREEVANTSTSSGTHAGDEGDDQIRKALLRRGHQEVSRMD